MRRLHINIATGIVLISCFFNILTVKGYGIVLISVTTELEELGYDISMALFTGGILYFMVSELPAYLTRVKNRKLYRKFLIGFLDDVISKLESIKIVDYSKGKEQLRSDFGKLSYGDKVSSHAQNTIYKVLIDINSGKELLYKKCLPYIAASGDINVLNKIFDLIHHKIFSQRREYLYKEEEELKSVSIGIGAFIHSFYQEIVELKQELK